MLDGKCAAEKERWEEGRASADGKWGEQGLRGRRLGLPRCYKDFLLRT